MIDKPYRGRDGLFQYTPKMISPQYSNRKLLENCLAADTPNSGGFDRIEF